MRNLLAGRRKNSRIQPVVAVLGEEEDMKIHAGQWAALSRSARIRHASRDRNFSIERGSIGKLRDWRVESNENLDAPWKDYTMSTVRPNVVIRRAASSA